MALVDEINALADLDPFTQSDGPLGADWITEIGGSAAPTIVSNRVQPPGSAPFACVAAWSPLGALGEAQASFVRFWQFPTSDSKLGPAIRIDTTTGERYEARFDDVGNVDVLYIDASGVETTVESFAYGSTTDLEWNLGDFACLSGVGSSLKVWRQSGVSEFFEVASTTDTTLTDGGHIGFFIDGSGATQGDDFGGGALTSSSSVAGALSVGARTGVTQPDDLKNIGGRPRR